ncbi:MAG: histidinol-phosphate transaminase [Gammaproteobacteria bacterium]
MKALRSEVKPAELLARIVRPPVLDLPRYEGPAVGGDQAIGLIRLASNENPLGAGRKAQQAVTEVLGELGRYPNGDGTALREAIAARQGVEIDQVMIGTGSNEILELVAELCLSPGYSAVYSEYSFAIYPLVVKAKGAEGIAAPALNYAHDSEALLDSVTANTRVVFIANPNNPTATCLGGDAIRRLLVQLPEELVVVLDQAYAEYVLAEDYESWSQLQDLHPGLLVTGSFSKMHGLAALRIGYGIGSRELIGLMERLRQPFNTNMLAQVAAEAALSDPEHLQNSLAVNQTGRKYLLQHLQQMEHPGVEILGVEANFLTFRTHQPADPLCAKLLERGVLVRSLRSYQMPYHVRVTIGLAEENAAFISALHHALME